MTAAAPAPARLRAPRGVRVVVGLLVAVLVALSASVLVQAPALACSCATGNLTKLVKSADNVYTGVVQGTTRVDDRVQHQVLAQRLFKGDLASARVAVTELDALSSCSLGDLQEGDRWLFLTDAENATALCDGSRKLRPAGLAKVQKALGVGERIPAPDPQKAVFTPVETTAPEEFTRLAAPGGAAVLLGLLGLAVVGRLNRH